MKLDGRLEIFERLEMTEHGPRMVKEWLEPTGLFDKYGEPIARHIRTESVPPSAMDENTVMRNESRNGDVHALKGAKMQMSAQFSPSMIPEFWKRVKEGGVEDIKPFLNNSDFRSLRVSKGSV